MKIKFKGIYETRTTGCKVCGTSKRGKKYKRRQNFFLPSGRVEMFVVGEITDINESDANFLLDNFDCFEVVE